MSSPLILELSRGATVNDLGALLGRLPADVARNTSSFVFRCTPEFLERISNRSASQARNAALRRVGTRRVFLLLYSAKERSHEVWALADDGVEKFNHAGEDLERLRRLDLSKVLLNAGSECFYRASASYHFLTPSLRHSSSFVRVADAVRSASALDTLAFWLLPVVQGSDLLVTDTWSFAAVPLRAVVLANQTTPVDALPGHPAVLFDDCRNTLQRSLEALPQTSTVLFVLSAVATGDGVKRIKSVVNQSRPDLNQRWVAVYGFSNSPADVEILCRLDEEYESFDSEQECKWCREDSKPLRLDPQLYHLRSPDERRVLLTKKHLDRGRPFLKQYGGVSGVLCAHRQDPHDDRHHAFDVNVFALLAAESFLSKFVEALKRLGEAPDLVVTPDHPAGRKLGNLVSQVCRSPHLVHNTLGASKMAAKDARELNAAKVLLIVDDVVNTGTRLEQYNRSLRENFDSFQEVHFLVGVARPESSSDLDAIRRSLTEQHPWKAEFAFLEELLLPNWGAEACPWCAEYDILAGVSERLASPPEWLTRRLLDLTQRERGLSGTPFMMLPGLSARPLGDGSPLGPAGLPPMAALAGVAAGLQELRSDEREGKRLSPEFPMANVFSPGNLFRYSEGLLRACLLRAVRPREWGESFRSSPMEVYNKYIRRDGEVLGELLLAVARRAVLPWPNIEPLEELGKLLSLEVDAVQSLLRLK